MKRLLTCLMMGGALLPAPLLAQSLVLDYGTFYGHMKTERKADFGLARLGFYLRDSETGQPCLAQSVRIHSDNRDRPAEVAADGGLTLPFDEQVYLDKGKVLLEMDAPHERCDLSVQVMASLKPDSEGRVALSEIAAAQRDMQALLDKMAGMVGKHFLPEVAGVRVSLAPVSGTAYLDKGSEQLVLPWKEGSLLLGNAQLSAFEGGTLQPNGELIRLTPWLHKG
ncbi:DUF2987 domain-containing protein [Aeromonas sp. BIGb0445]|jgi:hypothetical protein|uniref:DUF2987 domain-containing protein n=1 Tax=Aeromonas sp. BIGb0445 TaxID=2940593 RepID=UPI002168EDB3|nr:DUF2987 domain-containing protein [Aeromonas sp. BIGb0445]MCS3459157.1 hypothetical protein [Aeromonas sp. BIGb0445]